MTTDGEQTTLETPETLPSFTEKLNSFYNSWFYSLKYSLHSAHIYQNQYKWQITHRSLNDFFGIRNFSRPKSCHHIQCRLQRNGRYFISNYILITLIFCTLILVLYPSMFYGSFVLILIWIILFYTKTSPIRIPCPWMRSLKYYVFSINNRHDFLVCFLFTVLFIYLLDILTVFLYSSTMGVLVSITHMVLHKSRKNVQTNGGSVDLQGVENKEKYSDLGENNFSDSSSGNVVFVEIINHGGNV